MAEYVRRAVRETLPVQREGAWMRYAGFVTSGLGQLSHHLQAFVCRAAGAGYLRTSALVVAEGRGTDFLAFLEALPGLQLRLMPSRFGDQNLTLADAHGLATMKDRQIGICWFTDRHLGLTGVDLAC